jgi:hypothetical protein
LSDAAVAAVRALLDAAPCGSAGLSVEELEPDMDEDDEDDADEDGGGGDEMDDGAGDALAAALEKGARIS